MDTTTARRLADTRTAFVLAIEVVCLRALVDDVRTLTNTLVDVVVQDPPDDVIAVPLLQALGHIRARLVTGMAVVDDIVGDIR